MLRKTLLCCLFCLLLASPAIMQEDADVPTITVGETVRDTPENVNLYRITLEANQTILIELINGFDPCINVLDSDREVVASYGLPYPPEGVLGLVFAAPDEGDYYIQIARTPPGCAPITADSIQSDLTYQLSISDAPIPTFSDEPTTIEVGVAEYTTFRTELEAGARYRLTVSSAEPLRRNFAVVIEQNPTLSFQIRSVAYAEYVFEADESGMALVRFMYRSFNVTVNQVETTLVDVQFERIENE